jgi:hypothetical protein
MKTARKPSILVVDDEAIRRCGPPRPGPTTSR